MSPALDSQTARLAWLLFPRAVTRKALMFAAYFDDSGTHDDTGTQAGAQFVAAAGYVAPPAEWERFEAAWNAFLRRNRLPYFHAVDCAHAQEHFKGKEKPECNRLYRNAVEIITAHKLVAVGYAGMKAAFNEEYIRAIPDERRRVDKASYFSALLNAWRLLGLYVSSATVLDTGESDEKVSIVVEDSPHLYAPTMAAYRLALEDPNLVRLRHHSAGPPTFRPKEGYPQLQAADVLAYEMTLNLRRMFIRTEPQRHRASYNALVAHAHPQTMPVVGFATLVYDSYGLDPRQGKSPA